jgi:hydrogenase/urease accessory protein HupE
MTLMAIPVCSFGHPLDPALLELKETQTGIVDVLWRTPLLQPKNAPLSPVLPDRCQTIEPAVASENGQQLTQTWRLDCGKRSLVGERIGLTGLEKRKTDALMRVKLADGRLIQGVLRAHQPTLEIQAQTSRLDIFHDYLDLGLEHILTGFDHLLFVLGLLLLVRIPRRLFWTITAFTLGHSVTLSLAVLGWIHVPPQPIEILIAASIFVVAVELARQHDTGRETPWIQRPWLMALLFGFLHGLGFAGALAEVGLPDGEIPWALFSFNLGIELGQLIFLAAVLSLGLLARRGLDYVPTPLKMFPAYLIGSLSAFWIFERIWVML